MYEEFFALKEKPFSLSPDPRYLFHTERHREALAHLLFVVQSNGGFVLLSGEVGTGKTTVCRCVLEKLPESTQVALIINPKLTVREFLASICDELGVDYPKDLRGTKDYIDLLNQFLLESHAQQRDTLLIIDEAQNLSSNLLEHIRLLTNLETNDHKLLQIILLGQPELLDMLERSDLRQLTQRISARYHLEALSHDEVGAYVDYRLTVAGGQRQLFTQSCINRLYELTDGVPRLINNICDRALLGSYIQRHDQVKIATLNHAAAEVLGEREYRLRSLARRKTWPKVTAVAALFIIALGCSYWALQYYSGNALWPPSYLAENNTTSPSETQQTVSEPAPSSLQATVQAPVDSSAVQTSLKPANNIQPVKLNEPQTPYQQLFSRWQLPFDQQQHGDPCLYAKLHGLACLRSWGNWEQLQKLDRPSIITVLNSELAKEEVLVEGVEADQVLLMSNNIRRKIPLSTIRGSWTGRFTLLWRPPSSYQRPTRVNQDDAISLWLQKQLQQINGSPIILWRLERALKQFQRQQGLSADGIIGPQTLIRLNSLLKTQAPSLSLEPSSHPSNPVVANASSLPLES